MINRVITPSKVTAWFDCPHYLTLRNQADDGLLPDPGQLFGSFARLLVEKGLTHESACLADYQRQGKSTLEVPARRAPGRTLQMGHPSRQPAKRGSRRHLPDAVRPRRYSRDRRFRRARG